MRYIASLDGAPLKEAASLWERPAVSMPCCRAPPNKFARDANQLIVMMFLQKCKR